MFYKYDFYLFTTRNCFSIFTFLFIILIIFNILSPNEAFAMQPYDLWVTNYYGGKEYVGPNAYAYFHDPVFRHSIDSSYTSSYDNTNNPDYFIPHKSELVELDGKPIYKSINTHYDRDELHFWTPGQSITRNPYSNPVSYHFEPKHTTFELDSGSIEGTISTNVDSTTWHRRHNNDMEIIRDYCTYVDNMSKKGILSKVSLCVETTKDNIIFLYLKCNQIGKRKILWNIWERNRSRYNSYKDFKRSWDNNSSIWSTIKKDIREDIRAEVEDLLGVRKIKKDIKKSVRGEVEKLLRESRPFGK